MFPFLYLLLLVTEGICDDVISAEKDYIQEERTEKHVANADSNNRRLEDDKWHVAHLKDSDFSRSECPAETEEDKAQKYRKMLKSDGALVEFVSADPLPFEESDLKKTASCKKTNDKSTFKQLKSANETKAERNSTLTTDKTKKVVVKKNLQNGTFEEGVDTATPASMKKPIGKEGKVHNARKASEYQFSSVEYYDEEPFFDPNTCPDAVKVIILEQDQLRTYDVECEKSLEWRSLD